MERRRLTGLIALIALIAVVGVLVYVDARNARQEPTTAFAPAESADESVPPPDATIEQPADVAAAPDASAPADTQVAMGSPTTEEPAAPPAASIPAGTIAPSFDVVRVEPSGEAVVAGQAEPNATVEILDGPTAIATAQANERGEWVLTLDKPLTPGAHDLAVRTTSPDKTIATLSDQRVTVSVPESGSKDVLVVLNAPNAPSKVLQVAPSAGGQAAVEGQAAAIVPQTPLADQQVAMAPATDDKAASDEPLVQRETQSSDTAVASAPATGDQDIGKQTAVQDKSTDIATAAEPPIKGEPPTASEAPIAGEPPVVAEAPVEAEPAIAGEPQVAAKAPPPPPTPDVVVAAVEADTSGLLYIAGTAATGETVRVYLDGTVIGDAKPSPSGTWLLETTRDMPAGQYMVRADQVDAGGKVVARSEVPFERSVEVATLRPTGMTASAEGPSLAGAMPEMETVIIKRGDNLWRIARAAWGKGVRWSTIYQANGDQIRDPHWIYPGQVFVMPKGNTAWTDDGAAVQN